MGGVAQGVKNSVELLRHIGVAGPHIGGRDHQILGKGPAAVDPHALGLLAVLLVALQAVAALAAGNVPLAGHQIAGMEALHAGPHLHHFAHILMARGQAHRDGMLGPVVPLVDVHIRTADGGFPDLNFHVVGPQLGDGDPFHPQALLRLFLYQCPH